MYADDTVMYFTNIYTSEIAWVEKSMLFAWSCMAESCQITKVLFTVIRIRLQKY